MTDRRHMSEATDLSDRRSVGVLLPTCRQTTTASAAARRRRTRHEARHRQFRTADAWGETPEPRATTAHPRHSAGAQRAAAEAGELWTIDEVADYLGVPRQTVYRWRTSGYGPAGFRVGKHLRWRASTVIAWTLELERQG